jgi:hypothetical protein
MMTSQRTQSRSLIISASTKSLSLVGGKQTDGQDYHCVRQLLTLLPIPFSDGAITGLDLAMNYSSRIERVFAHGANLQANYSIPGVNDPIITSKTGSLDSDFSTGGVTLSLNGNVQKRESREVKYSCQKLSPLPKRCKAMEKGVAQ